MQTIKVGIAGSRGLSTIMGLKAIPGVEITAMCDLNEDVLRREADRHGIEKRYRIFEDMLESDIDAVVIATPMQCHMPQTVAAMEAGKHVMSEVTAGVSMDELWWLCETVEKYGKIYMYAENYIYTPQVQLVKSMVQQGMFGETYYAEGSYLHNIGDLFVYPNGKTSWRSYWQCGKRGNFYPTHSIGPVMAWFPGEHITEISTFSPGVYNDVGLKQDSGTTTMCRTQHGKLLQIRTDCMSPRPHCMDQYLLQGTKGAFRSKTHADDRDLVSFVGGDNPANDMHWEDLMRYRDLLPARYREQEETALTAGHGGGDYFIVEDFIRAIRTNTQPELDVYTACEWTAVGLLSALSVTNNGKTIAVPQFRPGLTTDDKRVVLD